MQTSLFRSFLLFMCALPAGCASTTADIQLPDGTMIKIDDNKSREGVIVSWKKTEDGFEVFLSSQKSGTDPAVTGVINKSLDIVREALPLPMGAY